VPEFVEEAFELGVGYEGRLRGRWEWEVAGESGYWVLNVVGVEIIAPL
jgi:hypothetical protein